MKFNLEKSRRKLEGRIEESDNETIKRQTSPYYKKSSNINNKDEKDESDYIIGKEEYNKLSNQNFEEKYKVYKSKYYENKSKNQKESQEDLFRDRFEIMNNMLKDMKKSLNEEGINYPNDDLTFDDQLDILSQEDSLAKDRKEAESVISSKEKELEELAMDIFKQSFNELDEKDKKILSDVINKENRDKLNNLRR